MTPRLISIITIALAWLLLAVATAVETTRTPMLKVLERTEVPLLKADRPWEDFCIGYCTVIRDGTRWRLWYDAYDRNYRDDSDTYSCYAESQDGLHWTKPSLGIYAYQGSKDNNILGYGTHGLSVFLDASAPNIERYKAVGVRLVKGEWMVYGATSPDGLRWNWADQPLLVQNSDTQNVCIRDGDLYRLYLRMWSGPGTYVGHRLVGYSESCTFGKFTNPVAILVPDEQDPPDLHWYSSATAKLCDDLYLMFPSAFHTDDGRVVVHAAFSRDGKQFHRLGRERFLDTGKGFDSKGIYVAPGVIPAEKPGTFWVYYLGVSVPHNDNFPSKVRRNGGFGRFLLQVAD